MFGKGGLTGDRLQHVAAALLVFLRIPLGTDFFVIALIPVFLHATQSVKIFIP